MDDLETHLRDIKADFQRLADRAPWVRACFNWNEGKPGLFSFGHAHKDGVKGAVLISGVFKDDFPLFTELEALTDQAGTIAVRLIQTKRYEWKPVRSKMVLGKGCTPLGFWIHFLAHTPPLLLNCFALDSGGRPCEGIPFIEKNTVTGWIDNYPQVCVSALALLIAGVRKTSGEESLPRKVHRLVFEDGSRTVALDGVTDRTPLEPDVYWLLRALGREERCGRVIPGRDIGPGWAGKKMARVLAKLPARWRRLITSKRGAGGGYCLTLPAKKSP